MEGLTDPQAEFLRRIVLYGGGEVTVREWNPSLITSLGEIGFHLFDFLKSNLLIYRVNKKVQVGEVFRISEEGRKQIDIYDRKKKTELFKKVK